MGGFSAPASFAPALTRNIRHLPDVSRPAEADHGVVLIHLEIDGQDPLAGSVGPAEGTLRPFAGWLELLSLLAEQLGEDCARPPG